MEALFPAARGDCSAMFWRRRAEARLGLHMIRLHLAVDPPARVPAAQSGAATPRVTSIKGKNITVLLAGLESNASNAVGTWRADCSPRTAFTYPAVVVPVQTAINAGVKKVADLGQLGYDQTFGYKPKGMFLRARLVIRSRPHLHKFIWTDEDLSLEALDEEVDESYDAHASALPCSDVELVFYFEAASLSVDWRCNVGRAHDSAMISGQAVDPRFDHKVFAKMIGSTASKVDAATRPITPPDSEPPYAAYDLPGAEEPNMVSLNVVLLRAIQDKLTQLVKTRFMTLRDDIDSVLVPKKRAATEPPPGACPRVPSSFAYAHRLLCRSPRRSHAAVGGDGARGGLRALMQEADNAGELQRRAEDVPQPAARPKHRRVDRQWCCRSHRARREGSGARQGHGHTAGCGLDPQHDLQPVQEAQGGHGGREQAAISLKGWRGRQALRVTLACTCYDLCEV